MKILKKVSTQSLVIIVSHDVELMKQFANYILYMEDGRITNKEILDGVGKKENLPIQLEKQKLKEPSIPSEFLVRHSFNKMKDKKWRTLLSTFVMSLSLMGVGSSITLTSSISTNIKKAYQGVMGENRIVVTKKNKTQDVYGTYSASYYEVNDIKKECPEYFSEIGVYYQADYESFFPEANEFHMVSNGKEFVIDGLSLRNVNEYKWISDTPNMTMYPESVDEISDDEIVLGLTIEMVREICYELQIVRTVSSLSDYLLTYDVEICLEVENLSWGYYTEQMFRLKAFTLENEACIHHSNPVWNTYVIEDNLQLAPTDYISGSGKYPWTVKKIFYLKVIDDPSLFLTYAFNKDRFSSFAFEIADKSYYPNLYKNVDFLDYDRLFVFMDYRDCVPISITNLMQKYFTNINNPLYANYDGYSIYPSAFMSGFAHATYFASSKDQIESTIDTLSSLSTSNNEVTELPDGVLNGHFSNSFGDGVSFSPLENMDEYSSNLQVDDVVISTGLAQSLFGTVDVVGRTIYLAMNTSETTLESGKIKRDYVEGELRIIGVTDETSNIIHQLSSWSVVYFQSRLGTSIFGLGSYCVSFALENEDQMDQTIEEMSALFKDYDIYNPMEDFNLGVDEICFFIEIALLIFSLIAVVISILLLSTCSYLHILENHRDIGLARCLGISKKESTKFLFSYSLIIGSISFIYSSIEILIISFVSSYVISDMFSSSLSFSFNPWCLVAMFVLAMAVAVFSTLIFTRKLVKIDPISALK